MSRYSKKLNAHSIFSLQLCKRHMPFKILLQGKLYISIFMLFTLIFFELFFSTSIWIQLDLTFLHKFIWFLIVSPLFLVIFILLFYLLNPNSLDMTFEPPHFSSIEITYLYFNTFFLICEIIACIVFLFIINDQFCDQICEKYYQQLMTAEVSLMNIAYLKEKHCSRYEFCKPYIIKYSKGFFNVFRSLIIFFMILNIFIFFMGLIYRLTIKLTEAPTALQNGTL